LKSCANVASMNPVAIPIRATIHIQKIAPGPPSVSATATPAILPVPTRLASPIAKAWNEEMPCSDRSREPCSNSPTAAPNSRNWTPRVRIVK